LISNHTGRQLRRQFYFEIELVTCQNVAVSQAS
jgi:hypothetical protein